ncbi:MAG TPA: glycosyltransferase [Polyangiaceae bacterium]|nr:glycosyltransferase [Polyangiaceae bacterium]
MPSWLSFDFSPAVVKAPFRASQPSASTRRASGLRVGWLLPNLDVNTASNRYRCFHIARVLAEWGVEQSFYTDPDVASASLPQIDALIIVKRVEPDLMELVAGANERNRPVLLDLCDDLLHERHPRNVGGVHRMVFNGIAPLLAGVVTPTSPMAQRVRGYAGSVELPIHVIPDIAETEDLFYKTAEFATREPQARPAAPRSSSNKERKSVVWFGASGGVHSNFGIASLLPAMPALRAVNRQIPIELVLISNREATADSVVRPFEVPTRYEPWSPETVYTELKQAHAALLTTGDDDFSITKSANRTLQALSAGVPVVMLDVAGQNISDTELAAFSDCMLIGARKGLLAYLGPEREKNVAAAMTGAEKIIARYSPDNLAQLWLDLLVRQVAERRTKSLSQSKGRIVLVLENGDSLQDLEAVVAACRKQGRQLELVVRLAAATAQPQLLEICARHQLVPTLVADPKTACPHRLYGVERFVVEDEHGEVARTVKQWTKPRHLTLQMCSLARFREELDENTGEPLDAPTLTAESARNPGPFAERREPDGSAAWVFVVHESARGSILDVICREIGSRQPDSWHVACLPSELPPARNYWFSHQSLFLRYFRAEPERFASSRTFIWYTHPRDETPESIAEALHAFEHATQIIFTCAANREIWLKRSLSPERTRVVLGGADAELFLGHERGGGVVGLSSSFYERKNPDRLLELMRLLPHRRFHLIGRKWEQYALFGAMKALPNFSYFTIPYQQYPEQYRKFDVFLSMSTLEDGPLSLLEAMMCNAVPVASDTGFAPDLIRHGENGFLFDIDAPAPTIAWQIEAAYQLECDVRATVLPYGWQDFSKIIMDLGG